MFLGTISSATSAGSCWRRQRLRSAIATARLAARLADDELVELGDDLARRQVLERDRPAIAIAGGSGPRRDGARSELLERQAVVGEDADLGGDPHRLAARSSAASSAVWRSSARAAASAKLPPEPIASRPSSSGCSRSPLPRDQEALLAVGDDHQRLELAQGAVGAPVLGQLDHGALEVARELLELGLEAGEERQAVGGAAGEADQHLALAGALHLRAPALTTVLFIVTWPSLGHADAAVAAHQEDGGVDAGYVA